MPILAEISYVLERTYYSKIRVRGFLKRLINHHSWTGGDPKAFWQQVNFLDIQPRGSSQTELLKILDKTLLRETGLSIANCGQGSKFLYLDDGLFSGGRLGTDLENWIKGAAPANAELLIAVIARHAQGDYFTGQRLSKANTESRKNVTIKWAHQTRIEDGIFHTDSSDVLRPTGPGADPAVAAYIATLGKQQTWRRGSSIGPKKIFSTNQGREVLEQEFLKMGVHIRSKSPFLNEYQRPLGNTTMRTFGFGTLFATYRNCPNNAPLALWAGDPWYPLLRRVTN